jgi:hypothetical protein
MGSDEDDGERRMGAIRKRMRASSSQRTSICDLAALGVMRLLCVSVTGDQNAAQAAIAEAIRRQVEPTLEGLRRESNDEIAKLRARLEATEAQLTESNVDRTRLREQLHDAMRELLKRP